MKDESIKRIMTPHPKKISLAANVGQAVDILKSGAIHHLPVVDNGKLVGIVSTTDLICVNPLNGNRSVADINLPIEDIMKPNPISLKSNVSLRIAAETLSSGEFHSLPIVDHQNILVGIVTSTDLIKHLLMHIPKGDGSLKPVSLEALKLRVQLLEEVRVSAELYLRTGLGEHEHATLLEKLAAARNDGVNI